MECRCVLEPQGTGNLQDILYCTNTASINTVQNIKTIPTGTLQSILHLNNLQQCRHIAVNLKIM